MAWTMRDRDVIQVSRLPMTYTRYLLLSACLLLCLLMPSRPVQAQEVRAYVSVDSVVVGERFFLTLVAEHSFMVEPSFPEVAETDSFLPVPTLQFGDLDVIRRQAFGQEYGGEARPGIRRDSVIYEVATFALDTAFVAPIPVRFTANEDTFSIATAALEIPVVSIVPPDAEDIRGLAPLVEFPRPWWPWFLLALALIVLIGSILYYLHAKRRASAPVVASRPPVPPYKTALNRLQTLQETYDPSHPDEVKPYFVELADVLRTYLEQSTGVPALERTTRELNEELERRADLERIPEEAPRRIHEILDLADLVKFADIIPPLDRSRNALAATEEALELIESYIRPPQPAPPSEEMAMSEV